MADLCRSPRNGCTPENGLLVPYDEMLPMRRGTRFQFSPRGLEDAVNSVMEMSVAERTRLGQQTRSDYEQARRDFERSLAAALSEV